MKPSKEGVLALLVASVLVVQLATVLSLPVSSSSPPTLAAPIRGFKLVGPAPADLPVFATLGIPLRNVAQLDSLVMRVSDPASPDYRHFITPQQAATEFLPTADFASLLSAVRASGLQVVFTALDSEIVVRGTADQLQSALGARIQIYTNGTFSYYASSGPSSFDGAYLYASNSTLITARPAVTAIPRASSNVTFTSGSFSAKLLQPVYNASYFLSNGRTGAGKTIGILDFYGSPTIASDLALFDRTFGFPDATLNVIPIGPYDPNLGANIGWSTEVSLDVETSHAMAPGATIDLYAANGALPLSAAIAQIVQDDKVTTLSQSFGIFEWFYSLTSYLGGPGFLVFNALLPDQYYALGSAEGISFMASSGDAGGSGYSSGPEGDLEYPASSPFVTSVGGTQTYFSATSSGGQTFRQTAWSNIGFVPNVVNQGGGGGGVSILEPKPWYQQSQATPPSYPNGRLNPDLSLQAGIDPATLIVDSGKVTGEGGTSESSPLLAGLLTLVAQSARGSLGLVNPLVYGAGNDQKEYARAFQPITFGYTVPWTASYGYNLATGWGAPNVGELATYLNATVPKNELTMMGVFVNATGKGQVDFFPGQALIVNALVAQGNTRVTTGSFTLQVQSLSGATSPVAMAYNPRTGNWTGSVTLGQQSGLAYVYMSGSSGGATGQAMGVFFAGYLGSLTVTGSIYSLSIDPWTWDGSTRLSLTVFTSDLNGNPKPAGPVSLAMDTYTISNNQYTNSGTVSLMDAGSGAADGYLSTRIPYGPVSLVLQGATYGYAPMVYGIYLQSSYIYPNVAAEPGSVAPGQYLTVISYPVAPVNVYFETSYETGRTFAQDVQAGSNVTVSLLSSTGSTLSSSTLAWQPCAQALRVCNGGANVLYGQLQVPAGTKPGLYNVRLQASYGSYTPGGNLTGTYYSQVWVSGQMLEPQATVVPGRGVEGSPIPDKVIFPYQGSLYQGEQAMVVARITYANGSAATYGEFSAFVYPSSLSGEYTKLMHSQYASGGLIPLVYDPGLQSWIGNVTLPSPASLGGLSGLGVTSFQYSGPYDVFVTGVTADGSPTDSALKAQNPFAIQPYTYQTGTVGSLALGSQVAFAGATITASGTLSGDLFIGANTIKGANVIITGSQVMGTLTIVDSKVTIEAVSGGDLAAWGSSLVLRDSTFDSLSLNGSTVSVVDSSYGRVSPALPSISFAGLTKPLSAVTSFNVTVSGSSLVPSSVNATIDGAKVVLKLTASSSSNGVVAKGSIDPGLLNDGVHTLTVTAAQSDGLSSTLSTSFSTDAHQVSLQNQGYLLFGVAIAVGAVGLLLALRLDRRRVPPPPQV